jgi:FlaA1/EpsC-like NDP-sugar epimerase
MWRRSIPPIAVDIGVIAAAGPAAALLLHSTRLTGDLLIVVGLLAGFRMLAAGRLRLYRCVLRYSGLHVAWRIAVVYALGTAAAVAASWFLGLPELHRSFYVLEFLLAAGASGGWRLAFRLWSERRPVSGSTQRVRRVLIFGAGSLGELALRDLQRVRGYCPVGFLDDDPRLRGRIIHGVRVLGGVGDLPALQPVHRPDLVILAVSNLPPATNRRILDTCMQLGVQVMVAKGVANYTSTDIALTPGDGLRRLSLEDLLNRPSRNLDGTPVRAMLHQRTILVTGAGGTIGSELCEQIAGHGPRQLVVLDHSEFNLYQIEQTLRDRFPSLAVIPVLDDLADPARLARVMELHRPQIAFHAAAYKHVPMLEANPYRGVLNNVGGFSNLLAACDLAGVERLVLISTDKAVRPTNVMGASKRTCELILQNRPLAATRVCAVRFGNVLGSSGSVVPRFLAQIAQGGPVTVTHPDITRYFMLVPEAVSLVLQAGAMASQGEIFILDMGEPVKIHDMAKQLIFMTGRRPGIDIEIRCTGLRPGEKLYEELLIDDAERGTAIPGITVARPTPAAWDQLEACLGELLDACRAQDEARFAVALKQMVPEWSPSPAFTAAILREHSRSGRHPALPEAPGV